jgi:hypothetical protein
VAIFCQRSILRKLICLLATRLKRSATAVSSLGSELAGATTSPRNYPGGCSQRELKITFDRQGSWFRIY